MAKKRRAKNLTDESILQIAEILDGWSGKITWRKLIDAIELRIHSRYTRQALYKHERIRISFELAQSRDTPLLAQRRGRARSIEMQMVEQQMKRLKSENSRLATENERLLEQFVRWAYNASLRGLDEFFLGQPLVDVNRKRTKERDS